MTDKFSILVPLDGSPMAEQIIPVAQALAGDTGKLTFFQATPKAEPMRGIMGSVVADSEEVEKMGKMTSEAMLLDTVDRWKSVLPNQVDTNIAIGDPASSILETAGNLNSSMIAVASHGRGALGRLAFGSVADRVARSSNVPVLIVHPAGEEPDETRALPTLKRIVVPLDGSANSMEAIPVAIDLAKRTGTEIHLVTAVSPAAVVLPNPVGTAIYPSELYAELEAEMKQAAQEALDAGQAEIGSADVKVTQEIVDGAAVDAIESTIQPGDVIVMTSHGHGGLKRWLLGSVAEKLIRSGLAPVVLVPVAERKQGAAA